MDPLTIIVIAFVYVGIGNVVANRYFRRRHGVRGRLGSGWASFDAGVLGALFVSLSWPVAMFLPSVRYPELCTHSRHVLSRQEARERSHAVSDALDRERRRG